jgi:hypothetical protein
MLLCRGGSVRWVSEMRCGVAARRVSGASLFASRSSEVTVCPNMSYIAASIGHLYRTKAGVRSLTARAVWVFWQVHS